MAFIVVGAGSNKNQREHLTAALDALAQRYGNLLISPVYASPLESDQEGCYFNLVLAFEADITAAQCKQELREIEQSQGRERGTTEVTCDLDLLLLGDSITEDTIPLPHSDILEKDYVLRPLADLLPHREHPQMKIAYGKLWQDFSAETDLNPVDFVWQGNVLSSAPGCMLL